MATIALIMNNPEFNALHLRNVKEKKIKRIKSIMKLCGKLARLGRNARNGLEYTPEKGVPFTQAA
jgi:transposase